MKSYFFKAHDFFDRYSPYLSTNHINELKQLKLVHNKEQLAKSELKETYWLES
jgi:hypothetical protein